MQTPRRSVCVWSLFASGLLLAGTSCHLDMGDLLYSNPRASSTRVCGHPGDVYEHNKLWAVNWTTGEVVTDDDEAELRSFAWQADAFFEYDPNAPASSASAYPPQYGFVCRKPIAFLPDSTALTLPKSVLPSTAELRQKPCPKKVATDGARPDPRWFGETIDANKP